MLAHLHATTRSGMEANSKNHHNCCNRAKCPTASIASWEARTALVPQGLQSSRITVTYLVFRLPVSYANSTSLTYDKAYSQTQPLQGISSTPFRGGWLRLHGREGGRSAMA